MTDYQTMVNPAHSAPERFAVAAAGMAQLHSGRRPDHLIKELIQNAFDENPSIYSVTVSTDEEGVLITASDNGRGFSDISNTYTLMAETPKRMDPNTRGRSNLGDKEVISVSLWCRIETVGWTVDFPREGGRSVHPNQQLRGATVTAMMPWTRDQAEDLAQKLSYIRPPEGTAYYVNDTPITPGETVATARATLPTVIQHAPGEPLRNTSRVTNVDIVIPLPDTQPRIYEMGIPIQPVDLPYHVDIAQKVPMPPSRDTVSESYLKQVYTMVLNTMHDHMQAHQFADAWVKSAVESNRIQPDAVKKTTNERYDDKVVTWSSDTDANMRSLDNGFQVLHPRTMSKPELNNMRRLGDLKGAEKLFGRDPDMGPPIDVSNDPAKLEFAKWARYLGVLVGKAVTIEFVRDEGQKHQFSCTANTDAPFITFNVAKFPQEFFAARGKD